MDAPLRRVPGPTHFVTTCTDRKRVPVTDDRRLREVKDGPPAQRAKAWWKRLEQSPTIDLVHARDLYAGEHWSVALQIPEALQHAQGEVTPWVASAGYGLVGWDAPLKSYSATFSSGTEDSVTGPSADWQPRGPLLEAWWEEISRFSGPSPGEPRRLTALAEGAPEATIVVVASPDYVRAMQRDLLAARDRLRHRQRLIVVSNAAKLSNGRFAEHLIPVDSRARSVVGGTMQGLNARVAQQLFLGLDAGAGPLDAPTLQAHYQAMTRNAQKPSRPKGEPMTDEQVIAFIQDEIASDSSARHTRLLRKLRDAGRSCEQKRFRGLFQRVTGQT